MISHSQDKQFTDEQGESYQRIVSTLPKSADNIVSRMSDIIGYSRNVINDNGEEEVRLFMRGTTGFEAGSRWKHTPDSIVFTYDNLVNAIADAIEKQEKEEGIEATDEHVNPYKKEEAISFEEAHEQINKLINKLIEDKDNIEKIQLIVEDHLGKGRKIADTTKEQKDMVLLILDDLKTLSKE